jgi:hypothetical protein
MWAIKAVGAVGVGAGAALLQRRGARDVSQDGLPDGAAADEADGGWRQPRDSAPEPAATSSGDTQAALEAARQRLRRRAEELQGEIERGAPPD